MTSLRLKSNALKSGWSILNDFISLFFPNTCLGCRGPLVKGEEFLCTGCLIGLPKTNYHLTLDNPIRNKLIGRLPARYAFAFLKFRKGGIVQELMHQLKYNNHPEIGVQLGMLYARDLAHLKNEFDLIIPVPLHHSRKRKRGYNQSAMFAQGLSQVLGISWDESISVRKNRTDTQTKKTKLERWENVKEVFAISDVAKVQGKRILLVDDVITTGATLEACGCHLVEAGCSEISIACLAEAQ